jgi:hypothetical protein
MTVRMRGLMIGKHIPGALAPAWHGSQNLCSALVAAVVHGNELAARDRNTLAHLHERLASWALGPIGFQARPGFVLGCYHPRPSRPDAACSRSARSASFVRPQLLIEPLDSPDYCARWCGGAGRASRTVEGLRGAVRTAG